MPSRHSARYNDEAARHSSGAATQRENGYFPRAGASQPSPIYPSYPHPEAPPGAGLWHAQTYPGGPPMQPNSYPSSGAFPASAHQYGQPFPQAPPGYPMPYANGHHYPPGSYRQYHSPEASADYSTPTGSRSSPDRTHIVECEIEEPEDADGEGVTPEAREVPRIEWYPHKSNCDEESVDGVHEGYPKSGSSNQGAEVEGFRQVAEDNIPKCNDRKHPLGKYDLAVANSNKWAVFQWEGLYLQQDYVKAGRGFIRLDNNPRAKHMIRDLEKLKIVVEERKLTLFKRLDMGNPGEAKWTLDKLHECIGEKGDFNGYMGCTEKVWTFYRKYLAKKDEETRREKDRFSIMCGIAERDERLAKEKSERKRLGQK